MLVSCSFCGGVHSRGVSCNKRTVNNSRIKEANYITRFRSSRLWRNKREQIKTRDKFLCQVCLQKGKYNFYKLEVHHIRAISKAWAKRLDENNLITLCCSCHKMAEKEEISARELLEILKNVHAIRGVY